MNVPLPIDDQGRSEIAGFTTRRELVEYLGGLLQEANDWELATVDDWAVFRSHCHAVLPAAQAEWIEYVSFETVRAEARRQTDEGWDAGVAAVQDDERWALRAVDGEYAVQEADPDEAREGRDWVRRLLFRRRRSVLVLDYEREQEIARVMQEPRGGWDAYPGLRSDRGSATEGKRASGNRGKQSSDLPVVPPEELTAPPGTKGARLRK
jgi:hypothetical protein